MARRTHRYIRGYSLSEVSSARSSEKEAKTKTPKDKDSFRGLKILATITAACIVLLIAGLVLIIKAGSVSNQMSGTLLQKDPENLSSAAAHNELDETVTNIAFFGVDSRNGEFSGQSDVNMIISVDNIHKKIKITSVGRDTKLPIKGETLIGGVIDWDTKLNSAYREGGASLATETLSKGFDIDLDGYVTLNFAYAAKLIDKLGGVDINLSGSEIREINRNLWKLFSETEARRKTDLVQKGDDPGGEKPPYSKITREDYIPTKEGTVIIDAPAEDYDEGVYHLNGDRALAYIRIRNVDSKDLDPQRQYDVLKGLEDKLKEKNLSDYASFIGDIFPCIETSLSLNELVGLTPILLEDYTRESLKIPDIEYETDLYHGPAEDGISYMVYDTEAAGKRINSFIYEEFSPHWDEYGNTGRPSSD